MKEDESGVRCERGEYLGEVGDETAFSPGCDRPGPDVDWRDKGESGRGTKFSASRGDLVRRRGATVSPFTALVTKLVDEDDGFETGAEARELYVELEFCEAPDKDLEEDAETIPEADCDVEEGFDRDRRNLSIDLEVDACVESKGATDCALKVGRVEFDVGVNIESIEKDEVGAGLVLDDACPEPEEDGTAPLDKTESSLPRQSSASENAVEVTLDSDAEYAEETDTDAVNSCARPLDRSYSVMCSEEGECKCMSGDRGLRLTAKLPGRGSEGLSGFAAELPG